MGLDFGALCFRVFGFGREGLSRLLCNAQRVTRDFYGLRGSRGVLSGLLYLQLFDLGGLLDNRRHGASNGVFGMLLGLGFRVYPTYSFCIIPMV